MRCTPSVFRHTSGREVYRSQLRSFCRQRSHYGARAQKCVVIYDAGPLLVPVCDRCPDVRAVGFVEKIVHLFNYPVHFFTVQRELVLSVFFQRYTDCRTWVCSSSSTPPELRSRRPFSCGNIVSIYPWQIVLISMPRCSSIFIVHISYGNPESSGGLRRRGNEASAVLKHMYQTVRGRHRRAVRRERIICAGVYSPDRKSTLTVGRSGICAE